MKLLTCAATLLALSSLHAFAANTNTKIMNEGVHYAPPGGYQGLVQKVSLVNGQVLDILFTPYALGSDRWNMMPPVIPGTQLHMEVSCMDTAMLTCHMTNQMLSDAMNASMPVNFVVERNAGISFISEFVPSAPIQ